MADDPQYDSMATHPAATSNNHPDYDAQMSYGQSMQMEPAQDYRRALEDAIKNQNQSFRDKASTGRLGSDK